jgi:hypothetical protein
VSVLRPLPPRGVLRRPPRSLVRKDMLVLCLAAYSYSASHFEEEAPTTKDAPTIFAGSVPRTIALRQANGIFCLDVPGAVAQDPLVQLWEVRCTAAAPRAPPCAPSERSGSGVRSLACRLPTRNGPLDVVRAQCNGHTNQLWLFDDGSWRMYPRSRLNPNGLAPVLMRVR